MTDPYNRVLDAEDAAEREEAARPRFGKVYTMTEEHMQWWEQLVAGTEYLAWAKTRGLLNRRYESWRRQVTYNSAVYACECPLTRTELMTSDPAKLSLSDYNRYMRIQTGDPCYGRRGY